MTVADLKLYLASLSEAIKASGSQTVSEELAIAARKLEAFGDMKLRPFVEVLEKMYLHLYQNGEPPKTPGSSRPITGGTSGPPSEKVKQAVEQLEDLFARVLTPEITETIVRMKVEELKELSLIELQDVTKRFGIAKKPKSKKESVQYICEKILDRRGSFYRAQK